MNALASDQNLGEQVAPRDEVPQEIETLRLLINREKLRGPISKALAIEILSCESLSGYEPITWFRERLREGSEPDTGVRGGLMVGFFEASYNPNLSLEMVYFNTLESPKSLVDMYPSTARPIRVLSATSGFSNARAVAIFPELFLWPNLPATEHPAFYFINKFWQRFETKTCKILRSAYVSAGSFPALQSASAQNVIDLAVAWVHLHEHFHMQGLLPIPKYRWIKGSRTTAAFEELRVDVLATLEAMSRLPQTKFGAYNSRLLCEFILAERLLRYPIEGHPMTDYDARCSNVLLSALLRHGGVKYEKKVLTIVWGKLRSSLENITNEISNLEVIASTMEAASARHLLASYVNDHSILTVANRQYFQHPLYEDIRRHVFAE